MLASPLRHPEAFVAPEPPDPLVVELPAGPAAVRRAPDGNPSFATIVKVTRALGLRIRFTLRAGE